MLVAPVRDSGLGLVLCGLSVGLRKSGEALGWVTDWLRGGRRTGRLLYIGVDLGDVRVEFGC